MATTGKFDLNMEDVLEAWGPSDATRELIANALDEHILSNTEEPDIFQDKQGRWHIRDHGRGLQYEHLTQAENEEKLNNPDRVIGKFGVGLKDALATLHRHGIDVTIHSSHSTFSVEEAPKHGFEEIETLHVHVDTPKKDVRGTDIILDGITEQEIEAAKQNFIRFSDADRLESTIYGDVYRVPPGEDAAVYVTGLKVATEENFLFSYDITSTTKSIRDALNRERSNVGRTAYTSRVKRILQACESETVAQDLVTDLEKFTSGETHDELSWKPIQIHAVKVMNAKKDVVVATVDEQQRNRDLMDNAENDDYQVVTIPDRIQGDIQNETDADGNDIRNVEVYANEYEESFTFDWVDESDLSSAEKTVWGLKDDILELVGIPDGYEVRLSSELRATDTDDTAGLHQRGEQRIILRRDTLASPEKFTGVLLHEVAHTRTLAPDQTREFENALTELLGIVGKEAVTQ